MHRTTPDAGAQAARPDPSHAGPSHTDADYAGPSRPAASSSAPPRTSRRAWLVPASLIVLGLVPALGGVYRVFDLSTGEASPSSQRFFDDPVPMLLHGVASALFVFLGAFQFTAASRRNTRRHRMRGMVFVPCALIAAATGLWMEAPYELPPHDGPLLSVFRHVFGAAMLATTLLGVRALVRRRYRAHGAWMMRTYAIGMGAGTQVVVFVLYGLLGGELDVERRAWLMGAAWALNLLFVEWILRRPGRGTSAAPPEIEPAHA
ncbi:MAG: DUF2306 domain-containing protein [Planctomycetota bacterium]